MANNQHKKQYLIYTRRSTDEANNQKNSLGYQVGECLKFTKNNHLPVADFDLPDFCKKGIIKEKHTAFKTSDITIGKDGSVKYKIERPKFKNLITFLQNKKFAGIICLCWDRISRNDQDEMIIKQLKKNGLDFRFVQTQYDKTSSGELHMDIDGMFSKHFSRVISEKVKGVCAKLREEGKCTCRSPIGYFDKGVDNKPFDSERAPLVKKIFEMYATGNWSLTQLAKWANQQGLTTKPSRRKRTKQEMLSDDDNLEKIPKVSRPVNMKTIEKILKNPFYIGKLKYNDEITDGIHQPLINISTFNNVQEILKSKNCSVYYIDKKFFTYRGFARCHCGRLYTPYKKKGINYYSSRCARDCGNKKRNIREIDINREVENLLGQIHFSDKELAEIEVRTKTDLNKIHNQRDQELDNLHTQQKRVYGDLNYLHQNKITLLRTGAMDPIEYTQDTTRLDKELELIGEKMNVYRETEKEMVKYILTFSELVKMAKLYYKNALDSEKQEIATRVFSELVIYNGELANYKAKEGYETLLKRHEMTVGTA